MLKTVLVDWHTVGGDGGCDTQHGMIRCQMAYIGGDDDEEEEEEDDDDDGDVDGEDQCNGQ